MNSLIHLFLSVFLLGSVSYATFANPPTPNKPFSYWVRIPKTTSTCEEEASDLGVKFRVSTKLQVTKSLCRGIVDATIGGEKVSLYSLEITYMAQTRVNPYIAILGMSSFETTPNTTRGAYETYRSCAEDLANQESLFEKETDLKSMAAYCEPSDLQDSFVMKIEGFGVPKKLLSVAQISSIVHPQSRLAQDILVFVSNLGADVVKVTFPSYFYYSKDHLDIKDNHFGYFHNIQNCEAQINSARDIFANKKINQNLVTCIAYRKTVILYGLGNAYLSSPFKSKTIYYSFNECMADRERAIKSSPTMMPIIGAICTENYENRDLFQMDLYTSR